MTDNDAVADILEEMADRLDAMDVEYKPRAYRRAADQIRDLSYPIVELVQGGPEELEAIEGVGEAIASKVNEFVETGTIEELEELRADLPVDMDALTRVEGIGPKRVGALYRALDITTLDELEAAAEAGHIQAVEGFGAKTQANILEHIPFARQAAKRHLLVHARELAESVLSVLDEVESTSRYDVAGSIRRWAPTIGDVDILVATSDPAPIVEAVANSAFIADVIEAGDRKARFRTNEEVNVDFRFVEPESFGAALQYFTGSKDHNVHLRQRAIDRDLKVNEYGVFDDADTRLAGETEESVYAAVDLPWMPPEIREARGEIEAADAEALPTLLTETDIRGDLHVHSDWSDGAQTIEEMATAAENAGHEYLAITDHVPGGGVRGDIAMAPADIPDQAAEIESARSSVSIDILHGVEANIESDGSIDIDDDHLAILDLVIASPHAALGQDRSTATDRLIEAIEHPHIDIIGHPTGRKLGQRPGLDPDIEAVAAAAADADVALEVNSHPVRLDLSGSAIKVAIEQGASIAISTDAHHPSELAYIRYGVHTARRGWAEQTDVLTTHSATSLRDWLA